MNCECPIWMYGWVGAELLPRQSTGFTDLAEAEALRASLTAEGKNSAVHGPTIAECIDKYLASRAHELGPKTQQQHRLLLGRLESYCEKHRAFHMKDLTVDLLEDFKVHGLPDLADTSKGTAVAKLRCFLRDAFRRGWIQESLVDKVRTHRAVYQQKEPYTDEEVLKILDGALTLTHGSVGYAKHPKTFRLMLEVMLETGMRLGDVIQFDPFRLTKGKHLWVYSYAPQKQKRTDRVKSIEAYLSNRLKTAIDKAEWFSPSLPFLSGTNKTPGNDVYERLQTIGKRCGVADCRPHRFRDTFAVRKLLAGLQLDDVSRLLGHSSVKVTETYYARWVPSRKVRLERLLAETIIDPNGRTLRDR